MPHKHTLTLPSQPTHPSATSIHCQHPPSTIHSPSKAAPKSLTIYWSWSPVKPTVASQATLLTPPVSSVLVSAANPPSTRHPPIWPCILAALGLFIPASGRLLAPPNPPLVLCCPVNRTFHAATALESALFSL
ncbi:hypothetical protein IF1G_02774 [Cordyceps javanica]|uniref:Uncharacterized protein n=1 Tax=Cordyceps javanica TaxID=43265 RepID=A0A545VAD2_9HYPO|nr:hypothetical protein IF1G_02774 [Cordyceps javanica]